jgi:hypothetical protein
VVGHVLDKGQLFGHHISNHLKYYPETKLFEIDSAISFIKKYYGHHTNHCDMCNTAEITSEFEKFKRRIPVLVFLLHHRFHHQKHHLDLVEEVLDKLQAREDVRFSTYAQIYHDYVNGIVPSSIETVQAH